MLRQYVYHCYIIILFLGKCVYDCKNIKNVFNLKKCINIDLNYSCYIFLKD